MPVPIRAEARVFHLLAGWRWTAEFLGPGLHSTRQVGEDIQPFVPESTRIIVAFMKFFSSSHRLVHPGII